jgi:hypothetical protein
MRIRHTVIFTFYDTATEEQKLDVIKRLNDMGVFLQRELGVTNWLVAPHIPETFKAKRAHLIQDGIFPNLEALQKHSDSEAHKKVLELTPQISDWMTIDTEVRVTRKVATPQK